MELLATFDICIIYFVRMYEYLLGVAEKIMLASVPSDILQKYHELKQSLLKK